MSPSWSAAPRRRLHLDGARAPPAEGQGGSGRGVRADRIVGKPLTASDEIRASDRRALRRAGSARGGPRCRDRRPRPDRRHLGGGRDGEVAPDRRVRAARSGQRPARRLRRVPVLRDEHELLRLARDLARPVRPPDGRARGRADRGARAGARRDRPGARRPRAAARSRARPLDPGQRTDALVRPQAPQDLAREPPRRLPARERRQGAARARARGLPLARPTLARPARRGRALDRLGSRPPCDRLPAGGRPAARARACATPADRGARARRTRRGADDRGSAGEAVAAARRRHRSRQVPAGSRRRAGAGQPVLRRGDPQLRARAGHRPLR